MAIVSAVLFFDPRIGQVAPLVALPEERAGRLLALLNDRMPPLGLDPDRVAFLSYPDGDPGGDSS